MACFAFLTAVWHQWPEQNNYNEIENSHLPPEWNQVYLFNSQIKV